MTRTATEDLNSFDVRVDHQFSASNTAFVRYSFQNTNALTPSLFGPTLGGTLEGAGPTLARNQNTAIGDVHQFSPTLLNEIRIGLNRQTTSLMQQDAGQNLSTQFGIGREYEPPDIRPSSTLYVAGLFSVGDGLLTPLQLATTDGNFSEKVSWVHGRQVVRVGFDYQYGMGSTGYLVYGRGFYTFLNLTTSSLIGTPGGNAFASFLTGAPYQVLRDEFPPGMVGLISHRYGFYAQDDIRLTPKLTVRPRRALRCHALPAGNAQPAFKLRPRHRNHADCGPEYQPDSGQYRLQGYSAPPGAGLGAGRRQNRSSRRLRNRFRGTRTAVREFSTATNSTLLFTM